MTSHFIDFAPQLTQQEAETIGKNLYGLDARAVSLPSERDQNFLLEVKHSRDRYILKISNQKEKKEILDLQNSAMDRIASKLQDPICPQVCRTQDGRKTAKIVHQSGSSYFVRLVTYITGVPLGDVHPHHPKLLQSIGRMIAAMDEALIDFQHPAADRVFYWDLKTGPATIQKFLKYIDDSEKLSLIQHFLSTFQSQALGIISGLRKSIIHNDANDCNILVDISDKDKPSQNQASGIIDFGDVVHSYTVGDAAVAAAYVMLGKEKYWDSAHYLIKGYREVREMTDQELKAVPHFIYLRLCMSVAISAFQKRQDPQNKYLVISEQKAWTLLKKLREKDINHRDLI